MSYTMLEIGNDAIQCTLCDAGASIVKVQVKDRRGMFIDVALPCKSYYNEQKSPSSAGRTIGPCCGRVRGGEAVIGGKRCQLTPNEGPNHLHGGPDGCAQRRWTVTEHTARSVRFSLELEDGLEGYPGNRRLTAEYTVDGDALTVVYSAATDAETWIDMTNHVYWDLSGRFDGSAMDQTLQIAASKVVFNDERHLPQVLRDPDDAFDFSSPCTLSGKVSAHPDHPQLVIARGFNNAYLLDQAQGFAARLTSPVSGICMTMTTDQPALVLYSGGFLGPSTELEGYPYSATPGCAVALEAQGLPDPFHLPGATAETLLPGQTWRRQIRWQFGQEDNFQS